jgi:hypothetical protein
MHIEVNVGKNLVRHLYGIRNTKVVRDDAEEVGVLRHSWVSEDGELPAARWVLPTRLLKRMNGMLGNMKYPSHYGATLRGSCSGDDATPPIGLKSHDYHKLMQHILPIALRSSDDNDDRRLLRATIYELCTIFR